MALCKLLCGAVVTMLALLCYANVQAFNFDVSEPIFKQFQAATTTNNMARNKGDDDANDNVYFGYSIAQHVVKSKREAWLLVGAPRDSTNFNGTIYKRSGAIYKCPMSLTSVSDCQQVPVDFEPNSGTSDQISSRGTNLDKTLREQFRGTRYDGQWLGVSVASTGTGAFAACAHKYVHYYNFTTRDEHAAYGACYRFGNEFAQEYKHIPCLLHSHQVRTFYFNNYAYCQAGVSLSLSEEQTLYPSAAIDTYMSYGMPGALNFRGLVGVLAIGRPSASASGSLSSPALSTSVSSPFVDYLYKNGSTLCKFDMETDEATYDGYCPNLWEKYAYTGMSHVLIARYLGRDKLSLVAAGAPRDSLYGLVRFFTIQFDVSFGQLTRLVNNLTLVGEQRAAYFGFAMAACDVNGDKSDDLIVSAPYFSGGRREPNVGAVYIYLNGGSKGFAAARHTRLTGEVARALFGHSLASLGDIDKDGFNDFAVGAPFEANPASGDGDNSQGAVYIYRGARQLGDIRLSQKIFARDVVLPALASAPLATLPNLDDERLALRAFGFSLSGGGIDMDGNGYPDLSVGALNSNAVLVLRTRPVVHVRAHIGNARALQAIEQNEASACGGAVATSQTCFRIDVCFELVTVGNDRLPLLNFTLSADANETRVYFASLDSATTPADSISQLVALNATSAAAPACRTLLALVRADNYDYLSALRMRVDYDFDSTPADQVASPGHDLSAIRSRPLVHPSACRLQFEANFRKECGADQQCATDLRLDALFVNLPSGDDGVALISFGESDSVSVRITLSNVGAQAEPAYGARIEVAFDQRLDFIRKIDLEPSGFTCAIVSATETSTSPKTGNTRRLLRCTVTNEIGGVPFGANRTSRFDLTFSSARLYKYANISAQPDIEFRLETSTLSNDTDLSNNRVNLLAKLKVRVNLFLYGKQTPEQVFLGETSASSLITPSGLSGKSAGNSELRKLEDVGPIIEHTYTISNGGPFSVNGFQLVVAWPYQTASLKHLLYLVEKPTKIPNDHEMSVVCNSYSVDPLRLAAIKSKQTNRKKRRSPGADYGADNADSATSTQTETTSPGTAVLECSPDQANAAVNCFHINCSFYGDFDKDERIAIKFTARLWNATLLDDYASYEKILIRSQARLVLDDELLHDEKKVDNVYSVATVVYSNMWWSKQADKSLPVWIYVVSVCVGLFLLLIVVVAFWKLGFFERKKFGDDKYLDENELVKKTPY